MIHAPLTEPCLICGTKGCPACDGKGFIVRPDAAFTILVSPKPPVIVARLPQKGAS